MSTAVAEVAKHILQANTLLTRKFSLATRVGKRNRDDTVSSKRPLYWNVDVEALHSSCLCLPSNGPNHKNWDEFLYILPVQEWAELFTGNWSASEPVTGIRRKKNMNNKYILECRFD